MTSDTLTAGSMFSCIGGLDYGMERTGRIKVLYQCEKVPYYRKVLKKHWPEVPCYDDIRTLDTSRLPNVDLIIGGPPCQDFSYAGKREVYDGDLGKLSITYWEKIGEIRPKYVVMENVPGFLDGGILPVLREATLRGYDAEWDTISAASVGAFHRRDRIFLVAVRRDVTDIDGHNEIVADKEGKQKISDIGTGRSYLPDINKGRCVDGQIEIDTAEGGGEAQSQPIACRSITQLSERERAIVGGGEQQVLFTIATVDIWTERSRKYWPTPDARKGGRGGMKKAQEIRENNGRRPSGAQIQSDLETAMLLEILDSGEYSPDDRQSAETGRLNPYWCELHMGFPLGWTFVSRGNGTSRNSQKICETGTYDLPDLVKRSFLLLLSMSDSLSSNFMTEQEAATYE